MIVEGDYFADASGGTGQVGVLASVAGSDVNGDNAQQLGGALVGVLHQGILHDPDRRAAIGRDDQTFHAEMLIG